MSDKLVTNALVRVIEESGLEEATKAIIENTFLERYEAIKSYEESVKAIVVTEETQVELMEKAKELRLELRKYRTSAEKAKDKLKAGSIKYGKAIQAAYNETERVCKEYEDYLKAQEDFAEIQAMKRADVTRKARQEHIAPYSAYVPSGVDLGYLSIDDYQNLYNGAKLQAEHALKEAQEAAWAEQVRLEEARIAREEAEKLRKENEELRKQVATPMPTTTPQPVFNLAQSDEEYLNDLAQRLRNYPDRTMNTPETQKIYDAVKQGMHVIADEIIKSLGKL